MNAHTQTLHKTTSCREAVEVQCLRSDLQISLLVVTQLIFSAVVSGKLMNSFQVFSALPRKFLFHCSFRLNKLKATRGLHVLWRLFGVFTFSVQE